MTPTPADADAILIWGCAVRGDFRDSSLAVAARYAAESNARIIMGGCLPDICPELLAASFAGEVVNWRDDEAKLEAIFGAPNVRLSEIRPVYGTPKVCDDAEAYKREHAATDVCFLDEHILLTVSQGCPLNCSYCSEKRMFPPYRSYPLDDLVASCRQIVEETGDTKVILDADSVGDYGRDIGSSLPELIRRLKQIHPDLQIGLQGFNPVHFLEFWDELTEFLQDGTFCNLRLPMQSGSDRILERMRRQYRVADLERIFNHLRELGYDRVATDLIIGFPGETERDYQAGLDFILRHRPRYIFLCGYMDVPQLPSYAFSDKVAPETIARRLTHADQLFAEAGLNRCTDGSDHIRQRHSRINAAQPGRP